MIGGDGMTPGEYALMLVEIRFIERDLQEIAEHMEELIHEIEDVKKRRLCN